MHEPTRRVMLNSAQKAMPFIPRKLRLRFSVRTLFAATTILALLLGLIGDEANRLRLHRQAVHKVHELGGRYGSVTDDQYGARRGPPWCPVIHDSLYADFEYVWFTSSSNAGMRDEDLAILQHFSHLKELQIVAPLVTDEGMVHVEHIQSLRELELYNTQVTSRGLISLGGIPLTKLVLAGPHVTDETFAALEAFPTLRKLMISESSVTDLGLAELEHVPELEKLFLTDSPICDSGLRHLTKLEHLRELDLIGLPITDKGISPLAALPKLQLLNVAQTHATASGLLAFRHTLTLKHLFIGPQPTSDTLLILSSALPGCHVSDSNGTRCSQGW